MSAAFHLKFTVKGRPNRARPDEQLDVASLVIGSRPVADVYIPDRLVADEAAALTRSDGGLTLEVLHPLAGVHVDGGLVEDATRVVDGSVLQLGHARIDVALDAESGVCTLTVAEQHLPAVIDGLVRREKIDPPVRLVDPGPQEHRWGRSPVMFVLVTVACVLGAVALLSFPLLRDTEWHTRGELAAVHQIGASEKGPASCVDCHAPLSSDYAARCSTCHEDYADARFHPFGHEDGEACERCHADHRGAAASLLPAPDLDSETGQDRLCVTCHGAAVPETDPPRPTRDRAGEPVSRRLEIDGFSHREHLVVRERAPGEPIPVIADGTAAPVDCGRCHVPVDGDAERGASDFAPQTYELCVACHPERSVPVHGRDQDARLCLRCHDRAPGAEGGVSSDLLTAALPATGRVWAVPPRGHDLSGDDCRSCHVRDMSTERGPAMPVELAFRHDHHVAGGLASGDDVDLAAQCSSCHPDVAGSDSLAGTPLVDTTSCVDCHTGGEPVPVPVTGTRVVVDPFHSAHTTPEAAASVSLASGCVACHVPEEGTGRMALAPGTTDCTACHTRHANVAQGRCAACHVDRDFDGNRAADGRTQLVYCEQGVFDPAQSVMKTTRPVVRFRHGSRGHVDVACADCHPPESLESADRVADVPWPSPDDPACVRCHALERFHR